MRYLTYFIATCFLFFSLPAMAQTKDEGVSSESVQQESQKAEKKKEKKRITKCHPNDDVTSDGDCMPRFFADPDIEDNSTKSIPDDYELKVQISEGKPTSKSEKKAGKGIIVFKTNPWAVIKVDEKGLGIVKSGDKKSVTIDAGSHELYLHRVSALAT